MLVWTLIAVLDDHLFIVRALKPADGYYKPDVYLYYALTRSSSITSSPRSGPRSTTRPSPTPSPSSKNASRTWAPSVITPSFPTGTHPRARQARLLAPSASLTIAESDGRFRARDLRGARHLQSGRRSHMVRDVQVRQAALVLRRSIRDSLSTPMRLRTIVVVCWGLVALSPHTARSQWRGGTVGTGRAGGGTCERTGGFLPR